MSEELPFTWKGKKLTYSSLIDAALSLQGKERQELVDAYCASGTHARANVGYFAGYYEPEKFHQILEIFEAEHPVFGKTLPTPEEAFRMGVKIGEASLTKRKR